MKTVNGNNKLERQINKAKKYLGVNLKESTQKYLEVESVDFPEETYILFLNGTNARIVKNNELWVIKPINLLDTEQPVFIKRWACIEESNSYWFNGADFIIFKTNNERFKELAQGCEDLWNLTHFMESKIVHIRRK